MKEQQRKKKKGEKGGKKGKKTSLSVDDSSVVAGSSSFRWSTAPRYDLSLNNRSARIIGSSCVVVDKLISRCLENRCQRLLKLLKLHVQLLYGHCHLLLWSRHGLLARGATRRARLSYPQRLPTFDSELGLQSLSGCFALSLLTVLTPASPGALRSTLSTRSSPLRQTTSLDSSVPRLNHGLALP